MKEYDIRQHASEMDAILDSIVHNQKYTESQLLDKDQKNAPALEFLVRQRLIAQLGNDTYTITLEGKRAKHLKMSAIIDEIESDRQFQKDVLQASKDSSITSKISLWISAFVSLFTLGVLVYQTLTTQKIEIVRPIPQFMQIERQLEEMESTVNQSHQLEESSHKELLTLSNKIDSTARELLRVQQKK